MVWSHDDGERVVRREAIAKLAVAERLDLFRRGELTTPETADFAADAGKENYIEAEPEVNRLLDHADPIVRYNAMASVAYEWGRSSRSDRIREILETDSDSDCRRQAAGALGSLFRDTRNEEVLAALVRSAKNVSEEMHVRAFAYTGALDVIGVSRSIQPHPVPLEVGLAELLALDDYLRAAR